MNKSIMLLTTIVLVGAVYLTNNDIFSTNSSGLDSELISKDLTYDHTEDLYAFLLDGESSDAVVREQDPNQNTPINSLESTKTGMSNSSSLKDKYYIQHASNPDTVGWLTISYLEIDEPIMSHSDNQFYLEHDKDKNYDKNGAVFLDAGLNNTFGKIVLLHGHNMKSGKIFGKLSRLAKESVFNEHPIIKLYDGNVEKSYVPFSVFYIDANSEQIPLSFAYESGYKKFFEQLKLRSLFKSNQEAIDEILIMQTCAYVYSPNSGKDGRLVVACYRCS